MEGWYGTILTTSRSNWTVRLFRRPKLTISSLASHRDERHAGVDNH